MIVKGFGVSDTSSNDFQIFKKNANNIQNIYLIQNSSYLVKTNAFGHGHCNNPLCTASF